jgi:hypothetical protein
VTYNRSRVTGDPERLVHVERLVRVTYNLRTRRQEARVVTNGREYDARAVYQIRVKGTLDAKWSDWFDGLSIVPQPADETLLVGPVADQGALHGVLAKIADLGLPLLSVKRVEIGSGPYAERKGD